MNEIPINASKCCLQTLVSRAPVHEAMRVSPARKRRGNRSAVPVVAVCLAAVLAGCAVTQQAAVNPSAARTGLVDYSRLSPGGKGQADLRWVDPAANWSQYKKVQINPVTFWADKDDAGISAADQQSLCDYMHQALYQQFSQKFQIADRPGRVS